MINYCFIGKDANYVFSIHLANRLTKARCIEIVKARIMASYYGKVELVHHTDFLDGYVSLPLTEIIGYAGSLPLGYFVTFNVVNDELDENSITPYLVKTISHGGSSVARLDLYRDVTQLKSPNELINMGLPLERATIKPLNSFNYDLQLTSDYSRKIQLNQLLPSVGDATNYEVQYVIIDDGTDAKITPRYGAHRESYEANIYDEIEFMGTSVFFDAQLNYTLCLNATAKDVFVRLINNASIIAVTALPIPIINNDGEYICSPVHGIQPLSPTSYDGTAVDGCYALRSLSFPYLIDDLANLNPTSITDSVVISIFGREIEFKQQNYNKAFTPYSSPVDAIGCGFLQMDITTAGILLYKFRFTSSNILTGGDKEMVEVTQINSTVVVVVKAEDTYWKNNSTAKEQRDLELDSVDQQRKWAEIDATVGFAGSALGTVAGGMGGQLGSAAGGIGGMASGISNIVKAADQANFQRDQINQKFDLNVKAIKNQSPSLNGTSQEGLTTGQFYRGDVCVYKRELNSQFISKYNRYYQMYGYLVNDRPIGIDEIDTSRRLYIKAVNLLYYFEFNIGNLVDNITTVSPAFIERYVRELETGIRFIGDV